MLAGTAMTSYTFTDDWSLTPPSPVGPFVYSISPSSGHLSDSGDAFVYAVYKNGELFFSALMSGAKRQGYIDCQLTVTDTSVKPPSVQTLPPFIPYPNSADDYVLARVTLGTNGMEFQTSDWLAFASLIAENSEIMTTTPEKYQDINFSGKFAAEDGEVLYKGTLNLIGSQVMLGTVPGTLSSRVAAAREILKDDPGMKNGYLQVANPPIKSSPGQRSARAYTDVIEQFDVEYAERYKRDGLKIAGTHCNLFVADVMRAMGAPLPTKADLGIIENDRMTAVTADILEFLKGDKISTDPANGGWRELNPRNKDDLEKLIAHVHSGGPAIAISSKSDGPDNHMVVIRPNQDGVVDWTRLHIAQAGGDLYNDTTLSLGWKMNDPQGKELERLDIKFFVHD